MGKPIHPNTKLFKAIYKFADTKNELELQKLLDLGIDINMSFVGSNPHPITLLAKQGKADCVDFLIDKFNSSPSLAADGYAQGGYTNYIEDLKRRINDPLIFKIELFGYAKARLVNKVNEILLQDKTLISLAAQGYANGGHYQEVDDLLKQDPNVCYTAILGYGAAGNREKVEERLMQYDAFIERYRYASNMNEETKYLALNLAMKAYIKGGFVFELEGLIKRGASIQKATECLEKWGYFKDKEAFLELLSIINDKDIRQNIFNAAKNVNHSLEEGLLSKAVKINYLINGFEFSFERAYAAMKKIGSPEYFSNSQDIFRTAKPSTYSDRPKIL